MPDTTMNPLELEAQHSAGFFRPRGITLVRGEGAHVYDDAGRRYLDGTAAYGVASLGHSHPRVVRALQQQAATLTSVSGSFGNDQRASYMAELAAVLPAGMQRIFLCNSGTESTEAALKIARLATGRTGVVAAMRCFHGRTMGALSATWDRHYREPFAPLVPDYSHVAYNKLEKLDEAVTDQTACVILEVVQGEGGVRPGTREFLEGAQHLCRERGALLVLDEVQTGFGRTGRLFAFEHLGLDPDIACLAKGIAGGVAMGATAFGSRVPELPVGAHGSTFGGNPLACAAARAVLAVMQEENIPAHVAEISSYLMDELRAIDDPRVREVRGSGLLVGIEFKQRVAPLVAAMQERGVLVLNAGPTVLRLLPPLIFTRENVDEVVAVLRDALSSLESGS